MKYLTPIALLLVGFIAGVQASPPPVQTTLDITLIADREFVEDNEEVAEKLGRLGALAIARQAQADAASAAALLVGARVRRGLVRHKAALDATLPATISDMVVGRAADSNSDGIIDKSDDITHLYFNADAAAQR